MIVVFGSINIDLITKVDRLPERGETVLGAAYDMSPGGKGANQALAARRAGADVRFVGSVGDDVFAEPALANLRADGVDLSALCRSEWPTGCGMIAVDPDGENQIVVASGANLATTADQIPTDWLTGDTTVLLQMEVPPDANEHAARLAKEYGARVVLNLAPAGAFPMSLLSERDILLVNESEALLAARLAGHETDEAAAAAAHLSDDFGLTVVLTLGAAGALAISDGREDRIPATPIEPVDTVGAGDAFAGVLAAALDAGREMRHAIRRAVVAGGLACLGAGAQSSLPTAQEIDAALAD